MRRTADQSRERILRIARDLFYWHGIRVTGVDQVASEADIAPTTLYRLFGSKDGLVAAYVEREAGRFQEWFTAARDAAGPHPREQILALFDALAEQVQPDNCRGCPFLMALAEFPDASLPAHQYAVATKAWVRDQFRELIEQFADTTSISDPAALADQLTLVFEGVNASVQALGDDGPARQARALVEVLLAATE